MEIVEILDSDNLYRRIHPNHRNPDGTISSAAFKGSDSYEYSVDLARLTSPKQTFDRAVLLNRACIGVASLTAGEVRELSQEAKHDPLSEEDQDGPNPAHALIIGDKSIPIARQLARRCEWVFELSATT